MSVVGLPSFNMLQPPPVPVWRFTIDEYHRMIETGVLAESDRVELLEGWTVPKMPHSRQHDGTVQASHRVLARLLPPGWDIRVQSAITTADSEPEPDLAIVRGDARTYFSRHPEPGDIAVVVEAAESSLGQDRAMKGPLFARAQIPSYWIINLIDGQVEVHTDPSGPGPSSAYRRRQVCVRGDSVPLEIEGRFVTRVSVDELLP